MSKRYDWMQSYLRILMAFLMLMFVTTGYSRQASQVSGKVVSVDDNEPLPGVSILVKGTSRGTVTNMEGEFSVQAAPGDMLTVSFIGFETQEVAISGGRTNYEISMESSMGDLGEVVVVGYGSQRKADITSAVSVINMDNIGEVPTTNVSRLLQGQAAGVQVRQNSGRPGEEMEVTIRGIGSLGAGSQPLYVVDGFPVGTSLGQSLNPSDIESMTVLKDAASTAIYGARGSNGVILITTKSAKEGTVNLDFVVNQGVQNIPDGRRTKMMNGVEFAQFKHDSFVDRIRYFENREPAIEEVPLEFRYPEQTTVSTDWFDEILNQNARFQNYNVTLSSGKGGIRSLVSVGYINQEGAVIETGFERFNVRANIGGKINDFITMGWNIAASRSNEDYASTNGRSALIGRALWADPRYPVYNEDGSFNDYIGGTNGVFGTANVVQELHEMERTLSENNLLTNGFLEFSFLKNFKFRTSVNAILDNTEQKEFRPSTLAGTGFNQAPPREATLYQSRNETLNIAADQLLSYSKILGNHRVDGLLGFSVQEETYKYLQGNGNEFPNDQVTYLSAAIRQTSTSGEADWSLMAYFARANYSFNDKYLLSASFRREGSSRFGANNKWGNFPAFSAGWRISEESFMPETRWITDMKLRASFGVTGNNAIGNYSSLSNMAISNYVLGGSIANGQILSNFANANLGWEQSQQTDIGLDWAMFDNRLILTAEYYNRLTNNMLLSVEMPVISGFTQSLDNVGKVQNRGLELALDYRTMINQVNIRSNVNLTINRNKVLEIRGENDEIWAGGFYSTYNVAQVGRPLAMFHGFKMVGIFNTDAEIEAWPDQDGAVPGTYKYFDANGDGVISYDQQDMIEIGNPHPDYIIGYTLGGDYKNFDFNLMFTGAFNYDVFRNIEATTMNMDGVFNILQSGVNRWRSAENPGDGRGATTNTWKWQRESNSRYVYDASHVWLRNITLGYTIPKNPVVPHARVFFSAENPFLFTSFPGTNPEVNTRGGINIGVDDEAYPMPRTFTLGATVRF
ncbi:SusC/RagA family TonB-linked outer membrane protein [Cyclobacterium marinum]|uniref:TonB-dependent receptor plug n=1 Tax=Cyclobacterium marinum (strain ATCC 25205 / DSM 745 / LMG 13164 / NCIMB 1802) TaxID=880070 RepID=G0J117_CYCMS|nr:TonB-dependent receptor [Cyclobacterium marinum]AEL25143.1 TonB-dependent receptor plug [Cyclobacterium marinum DSM 745]MBI0401388.1 TonB-dependent receptor [Cyclobacterium marinum]